MIYAYFEMLKLTYKSRYFNIKFRYEKTSVDRHYNEIGD